MARARLANRHDQAEAKLEFARRAIVEHEAGQACGWGDCDDALLTARAFAGVYGDIVLELLGRAMKNPLDWRTLGDLAATMPEAMTPEQTAAVRAYLLRLRETIAPRLR
jgi:hypothetical protein